MVQNFLMLELVFFMKKNFKVFHVLPNSTSLKNCLLEQSVKEFYNPIND